MPLPLMREGGDTDDSDKARDWALYTRATALVVLLLIRDSGDTAGAAGDTLGCKALDTRAITARARAASECAAASDAAKAGDAGRADMAGDTKEDAGLDNGDRGDAKDDVASREGATEEAGLDIGDRVESDGDDKGRGDTAEETDLDTGDEIEIDVAA